MSELTVLLISVPIMSISFCIITDGLEWKRDVKIELLLGKATLHTLILGFYSYPFLNYFIKNEISYRDLMLVYTLGFGLVFPAIGKLIDLIYAKLFKSNSEEE